MKHVHLHIATSCKGSFLVESGHASYISSKAINLGIWLVLKILYYVVFIPSWNPECLDPILNQGVQEGISYLAEGNY